MVILVGLRVVAAVLVVPQIHPVQVVKVAVVKVVITHRMQQV